MINKINNYPLKQGFFYFGLCALNEIVGVFYANPSPLLDQHLWDFSYAALITSAYYTVGPLPDKESKIGQVTSIVAPTVMLSIYEFASQSPHVFGTYDPNDILAYALGSMTAYIGIKLFSTKGSRKKVKEFLEKLNPLNRRDSEKRNLGDIVREELQSTPPF